LIATILLVVVFSVIGISIQKTISVISEKREQARNEFAREFGYKSNELVIIMKEDLRSIKWKEEFGSFLKEKSSEIAPIVIEKLIAAGKVGKQEFSDWEISRLKTNLLTYKQNYASAKGAVLLLGIDGAVLEIAEELRKDVNIEHVEPHYVATFD